MNLSNKFNLKFFSYVICILPVCMLTGPFLSDLIIVSSAILFLNLFHAELNKFFKKYYFFFIFWLMLIFCSFISENIIISLKSSLFYIRFFLFSLLVCYFLEKKIFNINFFHKF